MPQEPAIQPALQLSHIQSQLVEAENQFGFTLLRELHKNPENENIVISPLNISMVLSMALNGAHGETFDAVRSTLGFQNLFPVEINGGYQDLYEQLTALDSDVIFSTANSVWFDTTWFNRYNAVESEFLDVCRTCYHSEIKRTAFGQQGTRDSINAWIAKNTGNVVPEMLDEIQRYEVMFLINTVFLDAPWTKPFDIMTTRRSSFQLADGSTVLCYLMHTIDEFSYLNNESLQMVDLPYGGGEYSMTLVLPGPDYNLHALIQEITTERWHTLTGALQPAQCTVELPRFRCASGLNLDSTLCSLGMEIAFDPSRAAFNRICSQCDTLFYMSRVLHHTSVVVGEEGTRAAAGTIGGFRYVGVADFQMTLNRPFLFAIRERSTDTILFLGKIMRPEWPEAAG